MHGLDKIVESILRHGVPVDEFENSIRGFKKSDALFILEELFNINVPVAGGDVYVAKNGRFIMNNDNWYCEPSFLEDVHSYAKRSIEISKSYINNYNSGGEHIFVIVPHLDFVLFGN